MTGPGNHPRRTANTDPEPDVASASDAQLVDSIGRGSHDALAEVYSRHGVQVRNLARRLRHRSDADDVVQDVFLQLWGRPGRFDPTRGSLRSFLLMQAHGRSVDLLRSESTQRARETANLAERTSVASAVDDSALARLAGERVWQLLARLADGERQAIALAYFGGHTYHEVAVLLASPEGTIKGRIRSGLARLRVELGHSEPPVASPSSSQP
ncbi:MAG: sigma-70 family RNA polymerase sigma factor [Acidimicrobiia bacterium]|nr:sigma-70 family RNA polymerase sigma factor [Acidimicrobiia bacterium]